MRFSKLVTLTTDFGESDGYVAAMKGVVLAGCPDAVVVDACHGIPAQDIRHGAWVLRQFVPYFPPHTLHVAVVDPTVGSERDVLLAAFDDQWLLVPDNGLADPLLKSARCASVWKLKRNVHRAPKSATFHGRDVFAYAAGRLLSGECSVEECAEATDCWAELRQDAPIFNGRAATVGIQAVDRFGNLVSALHQSQVPKGLRVEKAGCGARRDIRVVSHYAEAAVGEWIALWGSDQFLEISVRNGSAHFPGDDFPRTIEVFFKETS